MEGGGGEGLKDGLGGNVGGLAALLEPSKIDVFPMSWWVRFSEVGTCLI